ncbi:DUF2254 domain-containing protein [Marinimicrobium sp. ABcell2]|uniref:DUF2254 domain-containing protein n=1 Tax=Marinimicrobium sp. ABcell2 TaxID=3069751 RepID=UPI0027B50CED|nr:DUF2254 domain-containing protein [Marinimicrobium sp. ABcell2]MDQ2078212.1 DUF2254 domain-containing protein [Marinimicrobium sp. ABcell2]
MSSGVWTKINKVVQMDVLLDRLRSSMWVVPIGILIAMVAAAHGLLHLDSELELDLGMAGADIEGARGMLQAVATSMVTVAGVVFSLTLLVLSQASSQYSPRVLRNFLRDRINQAVLGVFLGVYAYCLAVLRGMGGDSDELPGLTIMGGFVAALVSVVYLVYFFHHIAESLQLENILKGIEAETLAVIAGLYPQEAGVPDDEDAEVKDEPEFPTLKVANEKAGYIQHIELESLLDIAESLDTVIYVPHCVGDFIAQGKTLAEVIAGPTPDEKLIKKVSSAFSLGVQRSIQQDPAFGIRQMADVAMKALSPGVNDTTNAIMALDRISVIMTELSGRCFPHRRRMVDDKLRLVVSRPSFENLLGLSFDQLRQWGSANPAILFRLLEVLGDLMNVSATRRRRAVIQDYARRVLATAEAHIKEPEDLNWIQNCYKQRIEH